VRQMAADRTALRQAFLFFRHHPTRPPFLRRVTQVGASLRWLGGSRSPDRPPHSRSAARERSGAAVALVRCGMSAMRCIVAAPAWGARALPRRGAGGGAVGWLRRRGGAVLLPPPRMGRHGETLEDWCPAHGREDLLEEWDEPSRGAHEVTRGSTEKVWWKCGKEVCGHRWGAVVKNRTNGQGCPACSGRVPTATHNFEVYCQETGREELLGEWADRSSRPKDFTPGSRTKVPWQCGECGWGWEATIKNRTISSHPRGCPACAGRVVTPTNNLAVWCGLNGRADLLGEWAHPDKAPTDFTPGSGAKVSWKCGECGWGWEARLIDRTSSNRTGCPACAGRVVTPTNNFAVWCGNNGRKQLLGEWAHPDEAPTELTPGSQAKVPWQCGECRWVWEATISSRISSKRDGCPGCAGRVVTPTNNLAVWCGELGREDLLGEWAHLDKAPTEFTPGSAVKVPWKCGECGGGWEATVKNRTKSGRPSVCPKCNPLGRKPGKVIAP